MTSVPCPHNEAEKEMNVQEGTEHQWNTYGLCQVWEKYSHKHDKESGENIAVEGQPMTEHFPETQVYGK